eukprot:g504.t1
MLNQTASENNFPCPAIKDRSSSNHFVNPYSNAKKRSSSTKIQPSEARRRGIVSRVQNPLYYGDYLQLDQLLSAQTCQSTIAGHPAHDEHLFIVIHQAYELWFKQILHELDTVVNMLGDPTGVDEKHMVTIVSRLERITEIQRVLVGQLQILETMTPLGFLDFRDHLFPASGFQSLQFRLIEIKLGLKETSRIKYGHRHFCSYLSKEHGDAATKMEKNENSVLELVNLWLSRTPFLAVGDFNFWAHYQEAVALMIAEDRHHITTNDLLDDEMKDKQLAELENRREHFSSLFDEEVHKKLIEKGERRLSFRAMQAALLIYLYHEEEPALQLPWRMLSRLLDIDELLTLWRSKHSLMVHRMLGVKMGTGGSSGFHYLKATVSKHRVFRDLFNMSTFLIPRVTLPPLPKQIRDLTKFAFATEEGKICLSPTSSEEEKRKKGSLNVQTNETSSKKTSRVTVQTNASDLAETFIELSKLVDSGILTKEEFKQAKARLISAIK